MATSTLSTAAKPVNAALTLAALKAANTAQDASQDTTVKLLALRKELEALRDERDKARFRVEDLEAQTSRLHQALQRTSAATSALRNCPRRLPRSMSFMAALVSFAAVGMASGIGPAAAKAPATDATYVCEVEGKPPIYVNVTRHRFQFAGQTGPLHEGLQLNFTTRAGYTVYLRLGNLDRLHDNRPTYVEGTATVSKDGGASAPESAFCTLSGAARAKKQVVAKSEGSVQALKDKWDYANQWCRGGSGDDPNTDRGCALRERVSRQLETRGQCYAREINSSGGYDSVWRKCP